MRYPVRDITFQSTPSVGRATLPSLSRSSSYDISIHALRGEGDRRRRNLACKKCHFNPRPPWGGRLLSQVQGQKPRNFNPRPPWGGRPRGGANSQQQRNFNPRPPWGGRQINNRNSDRKSSISIHALRGEGDVIELIRLKTDMNFNPRPPWGGRQTSVPPY